MRFMNEWDVEEACQRFEGHPVLGPATQTLQVLVEWTNRNSDGWAYWPKPARAAAKLMEMIDTATREYYAGNEVAVSRVAYRRALAPIKSFRTRQGAEFAIAEL